MKIIAALGLAALLWGYGSRNGVAQEEPVPEPETPVKEGQEEPEGKKIERLLEEAKKTSKELERLVQEVRGLKIAPFGFSVEEKQAIDKAKSLISKKYKLPDVLFYKLGRPVKISTYPNKPYMIDFAGIMSMAKEDIEKEKGKPLDDRWHTPYSNLAVSFTIGKICRAYYDQLPEEEKKLLEDLFREVDAKIPDLKGQKLSGYTSWGSYFWRFPSEDMKEEVKPVEELDLDEQGRKQAEKLRKEAKKWAQGIVGFMFSEILTYCVLDHDYMANDKPFQLKLEAAKTAMERFKKE